MIDPITPQIRRRYIMGRQGLWPGRRWRGLEGTAQALKTMEAVQMDPVSVIAQSHDIVLWGRVLDYHPEFLSRLLYEERRFFDYGGGLMIYPMEELPHWRLVMDRRKDGKRWSEFARENSKLINRVKREVKDRGPLRKRELAGQKVDHYRGGKDSGVALYYLWLTGEMMTHHLQGKERVYDFLENVAPQEFLHRSPVEATELYFAEKAIAHLGLSNARAFRIGWKGLIERPVDLQEAKAVLAKLVESKRIASLLLEGEKDPCYYLADDTSILQTLNQGEVPEQWRPLETSTAEEVIFLSPLEYISARGRAKTLFDFDYIWEIYKPATKRQYGPYTMPVLYGDQLVARLDAKLDRPNRHLIINGFWPEEWFRLDSAYSVSLAKGLARFRRFLGIDPVDTTS